MDYEISVSENRTYIIIKFYAAMTTSVACRSGPELVRLAAEHNIDCFLFDVTQSANIQSVTDNYYFAYNDIEDFDFPKASRSAFLVRPDDKSHDFITTAFLNAGYVVKLFSDKEAALTWLEERA